MTIPYNAKFKSNWGYVNKALEEGGVDKVTPEEACDLAITRNALNKMSLSYSGPAKVMDWINKGGCRLYQGGKKV